MRLISTTQNLVLAEKVEIASSFWARLKGLLGRKSYSVQTTLWIKDCKSIHTFFMQFPIDVVFVDKNLRVCSVFQNVKPWRMANSYFCANSVFEFASPNKNINRLKKGELLYVGD